MMPLNLQFAICNSQFAMPHSRREFLSRAGLGFGSLALSAMLARDGGLLASEGGGAFPNPPAKAKSVIWIFLIGGMSQMESFDPKPELNKHAGKTIEEVTKEARTALTKADVMDGVADLIPMVQIEAVFTDGSRLVTVHTPIQ